MGRGDPHSRQTHLLGQQQGQGVQLDVERKHWQGRAPNEEAADRHDHEAHLGPKRSKYGGVSHSGLPF